MKVVGSIIVRLGSKRLTYKNLLPFGDKPMLTLGIEKLRQSKYVNEIVVSTESELLARVAYASGANILKRPPELAQDNIPSIPVFQHIFQHYPCDVHVNFNINFPLCDYQVIDKAIEIALEKGESLSVPYAVWAQTSHCLLNYKDPWNITAYQFPDPRSGTIDVHTEANLLEVHRMYQGNLPGW